MNKKEGYKNKLYYPHTSSYGYWLASHSAYDSYCVLYVDDSYGSVNAGNYYIDDLGVRPVVSLNSGIAVNAEEVE